MTATKLKPQHDYSLLITDDDEDSRDSLCDFFEEQGYRTFRASSGREAIDIARGAFLHFLILDMQLSDFSGIETFKIITLEKQTVMPCVFMSAHATKEQKLKALSAQAYTFVPKPINIGIIRHVVDQILDKFYPDPDMD